MTDAQHTASAPFRLGTRGSALATTQSQLVADQVNEQHPEVEFSLEIIKTQGDVTTGSLASLGGTGVFATALRTAVMDGSVDLVVHSLKDLPALQPAPLRIAAVPERADVRDALCARDGFTLDTLPEGASIGTGSPRRVAQLLNYRPDLKLVDIRGNVATRLARVAGYEHLTDHAPQAHGSPRGDLDAVILACAGLDRVGMSEYITQRIDPAIMLPAPGQGALAVEVSAERDLPETLNTALTDYDNLEVRVAVTAERALLARLEAGCAAPIGALAEVTPAEGSTPPVLSMEVMVAGMDGSRVLRKNVSATLTPAEPEAGSEAWLKIATLLGEQAAEELLADGADLLPPAPERGSNS